MSKTELTNGIVNDIKSKLEKFKQNKKTDHPANANASSELNFDINKDMLEKFKKSKNIFFEFCF